MTHHGGAQPIASDGRRNRLVRLVACAGALVFAVAVATAAMHHQVGFFFVGGGESSRRGRRRKGRSNDSFSLAFVR